MIDDLLDVSRISQGKVELKRCIVGVPSVINQVTRVIKPLIDKKKHKLIIQMTPGPLSVDADPTRLKQIIGNLLTNAAKYTENGGRITLAASRDGDEAVIRVEDTGVGIAPEMLPRVFDLFTQVDHSHVRSEGGLGIGLTLVKRLVELHGGTITATSEPGRGSVFTVRLPAREEEPTVVSPRNARRFRREISGSSWSTTTPTWPGSPAGS